MRSGRVSFLTLLLCVSAVTVRQLAYHSQGFTAGVFLLCEEPSPLKDNPGSLFAGFFLSVCCG